MAVRFAASLLAMILPIQAMAEDVTIMEKGALGTGAEAVFPNGPEVSWGTSGECRAILRRVNDDLYEIEITNRIVFAPVEFTVVLRLDDMEVLMHIVQHLGTIPDEYFFIPKDGWLAINDGMILPEGETGVAQIVRWSGM